MDFSSVSTLYHARKSSNYESANYNPPMTNYRHNNNQNMNQNEQSDVRLHRHKQNQKNSHHRKKDTYASRAHRTKSSNKSSIAQVYGMPNRPNQSAISRTYSESHNHHRDIQTRTNQYHGHPNDESHVPRHERVDESRLSFEDQIYLIFHCSRAQATDANALPMALIRKRLYDRFGTSNVTFRDMENLRFSFKTPKKLFALHLFPDDICPSGFDCTNRNRCSRIHTIIKDHVCRSKKIDFKTMSCRNQQCTQVHFTPRRDRLTTQFVEIVLSIHNKRNMPLYHLEIPGEQFINEYLSVHKHAPVPNITYDRWGTLVKQYSKYYNDYDQQHGADFGWFGGYRKSIYLWSIWFDKHQGTWSITVQYHAQWFNERTCMSSLPPPRPDCKFQPSSFCPFFHLRHRKLDPSLLVDSYPIPGSCWFRTQNELDAELEEILNGHNPQVQTTDETHPNRMRDTNTMSQVNETSYEPQHETKPRRREPPPAQTTDQIHPNQLNDPPHEPQHVTKTRRSEPPPSKATERRGPPPIQPTDQTHPNQTIDASHARGPSPIPPTHQIHPTQMNVHEQNSNVHQQNNISHEPPPMQYYQSDTVYKSHRENDEQTAEEKYIEPTHDEMQDEIESDSSLEIKALPIKQIYHSLAGLLHARYKDINHDAMRLESDDPLNELCHYCLIDVWSEQHKKECLFIPSWIQQGLDEPPKELMDVMVFNGHHYRIEIDD
eukprot:789051_1